MKLLLLFLMVFISSGSFGRALPDKIAVALNETISFPNRGKPGTENSKYPGVAFETLRLVEKEIGIPFSFMRCPYKRCLYNLEKGIVDAVMTGSYKKKREKHGVYPRKAGQLDESRRVYNSSYFFYIHENSPINWDGKTLDAHEQTIGVGLGLSIIDHLEKLGASYVTFGSPDQMYDILARERLGAIAAHHTSGGQYMHKYKNIRRVETPITSKAYYLLLSHQFYQTYPDLAEKIWDVVGRLREGTNEWASISERYFALDSWPEGNM